MVASGAFVASQATRQPARGAAWRACTGAGVPRGGARPAPYEPSGGAGGCGAPWRRASAWPMASVPVYATAAAPSRGETSRARRPTRRSSTPAPTTRGDLRSTCPAVLVEPVGARGREGVAGLQQRQGRAGRAVAPPEQRRRGGPRRGGAELVLADVRQQRRQSRREGRAVLVEHGGEPRDHALQVGRPVGQRRQRVLGPDARQRAVHVAVLPERDQQERRPLRVDHPAGLVERQVAGDHGGAGREQPAIGTTQGRQRTPVAASRQEPGGHAIERAGRPEQRERARQRSVRVVADEARECEHRRRGHGANPTESHGDHPCGGASGGGARVDSEAGHRAASPPATRKTTP